MNFCRVLLGLTKLYRPDHPDLGDCQGNAHCFAIFLYMYES